MTLVHVRARAALVVACVSSSLSTSPARAWESVCRQYADTSLAVAQLAAQSVPGCDPDAGPNVARQRWVGPLDEHRVLFEQTRERAGLPASLSATTTLQGWSNGSGVDVGGVGRVTLVPAPFDRAARTTTRSFSPGELAQLPDFSYALWDWAEGNETCPLDGVGADAVECHEFSTHMGPVNANHFLPQAGVFYGYYHTLAVARAAQCKAMSDALSSSNGRFTSFVLDCEIEALSIEAVGQHYLQDAWSMGHMWQRWGSADLADFAGASSDDKRDRAVLVALVSGLLHGSRGVLQRVPEWAGLDVNDAMCAPGNDVEYVADDGTVVAGAGDDFLDALGGPQAQRFFSCAASGMLEVYGATAMAHGALGDVDADLSTVDPTSDLCFGQRATNEAMLKGAGIDLKLAGQQTTLPLDSRLVSFVLPKVARQSGEVPVDPALRNQLRLSLQRVVTTTRILARRSPHGTQAADGALGELLQAQPNSAYATVAPYVDPALPWPNTDDPRALALARLFHRAHAVDWCAQVDDAALASLQFHVADASLDAAGKAAACDACAQIAARHLRKGVDETSFDPTAEPLCHFLTPAPAYVYEPSGSASTYCGCP